MKTTTSFFAFGSAVMLALLVRADCAATIMINDFNPVFEDFQAFTGTGFAPAPAVGQLDSTSFAPHGFSDGDLNFGDTGDSGDYARGSSSGGVSTGGAYAFDVGGGNVTLGAQPTGTDFNPGALYVKYQNKTGSDLIALDISAVGWYIDNEDRASTYRFGLAVTDQDLVDPSGLTYSEDPALAYDTPEGPEPSPFWVPTNLGSVVSIGVANDDFIYLRIVGEDLSGSGSRDEAALDDLSITAIVPEPIGMTMVALLCLGGSLRRLGREN
jgi:hypothetical protein